MTSLGTPETARKASWTEPDRGEAAAAGSASIVPWRRDRQVADRSRRDRPRPWPRGAGHGAPGVATVRAARPGARALLDSTRHAVASDSVRRRGEHRGAERGRLRRRSRGRRVGVEAERDDLAVAGRRSLGSPCCSTPSTHSGPHPPRRSDRGRRCDASRRPTSAGCFRSPSRCPARGRGRASREFRPRPARRGGCRRPPPWSGLPCRARRVGRSPARRRNPDAERRRSRSRGRLVRRGGGRAEARPMRRGVRSRPPGRRGLSGLFFGEPRADLGSKPGQAGVERQHDDPVADERERYLARGLQGAAE